MASRLLSPRFSKSRLIDELLEFSNKIAKAAGFRLDYGTSECLPIRMKRPTAKGVDPDSVKYAITKREMEQVITKAVEYGRATVTRDLATWVDNGQFGVNRSKEQVK